MPVIISKRAKWRKKIEDKLYKQHKKARDKFGVPKCNIGEIIREGYYRKSYTKKNGVRIGGVWVKPTCIRDRGLVGKGFPLMKPTTLRIQKPGEGIGPLKKGVLRKHGYSTKKLKKDRNIALSSAIREHGGLRIFRRLNAVRVLSKRTNKRASNIYYNDMKWIRKQFSSHFKTSWKKSKLFT